MISGQVPDHMIAGPGPTQGDQGSKKMPYTKDNPPDVCKGMPAHAVAIWVAAFNSAFKPGGSTEGEAMAIAMSAVKRIYVEDSPGHWSPKASNASEEPDEAGVNLTAEQAPIQLLLLAEVNGSPVEFLRTGTFTDMHGSEVKVTEADLDAFVANFESGAAGQDVPVDVDHKRGEAGGWVRRVYRTGARLLADVEWNEFGRKLVGEKVYRYLSASIDREKKLLRSISLVNFPAVKGLRPVELGEYYLMAEQDQGIIVAGLAEQVKVSVLASLAATFDKSQAAVIAPLASSDGQNHGKGVTEMAEQEQAQTTVPLTNSDVDLADFRKKIETEMREALLGEYKRLESQRGQMFTELMEQVRDERAVADFSAKATGEGAHALPIKADELTTMLKALPRAQREQWTTLLKAVADNGTVDFTEHGTARGGVPQKLDPETGKALGRWLKTTGNTPEDFFKANELGNPKTFDLTEWGGAK